MPEEATRDVVTFHSYVLAQDEEVSTEFIATYRRIFEDPPWNEYKKCPSCIQLDGNPLKFSRETFDKLRAGKCNKCGLVLVSYFSDEHIRNDLRNALSRKNPSCHFVRHNGQLIGFCYGCEYSYEELEHELELNGLVRGLENAFGRKRCAYQDEIAIDAPYRRRGYAKQIFRLRHQDFLASGIQIGVVRTQTKPPSVTYKWYTKSGYAIVAAYGDNGARIVLACDLTTLVI